MLGWVFTLPGTVIRFATRPLRPSQRAHPSQRPSPQSAPSAPSPVVQSPTPAGQAVPEWQTEAWKHRVEGEARKRIEAGIKGVGSRRPRH